MKIVIDLTSLADNFSGIERYAASLAHEMVLHTDDQYILVFKGGVHTAFLDVKSKKNVKCLILKPCKKLIFNQVVLPNAISKIKADYYLFMAFPVPIFLFKKNMVSTIHDICCWDCPDTMKRSSAVYFRISNRVALKKCKNIITISKFSEDRIVDRLNYDRSKIWRIYCGVDDKFLYYKKSDREEAILNKYNIPSEYILSLSTLEPRKNLKLFINAYRALAISGEINIPLVLAGRRGWKIDDLLAGIEDDVKKKILFTGFIEDDDLPAIYANARLFVFPSMYEGFGIPPLEALACGTPVLSSDSTSLPEVLGNNAQYFQNNNMKSLEEKIIVALKSENHEFVITYSWFDEANKLYSIMKEQYKHI